MHGHGLRFVLDIVPNHVGVDVPQTNPWWWDVLRLGQESAYAGYFDIEWSAGPILLPILDADEEKALTELGLSEDRTELRYYEHTFPVAPGTADAGTAAEVHQRQHYRLTSWKRGAAELTYRRFFDISTLAAVRVEIPEVFDATHRELLRWVAEDGIDGLRVDHPDGLSDPGGYMRRLRAAIGPDRWLVVEKILGVGEALPASWPVDGTSGYEALREIQGVFVDPDGAGLLTQFAAEHTGRKESLHEAEHAARLEVARTILAAEVSRIARELDPPASTDAVAELLCAFPVYRSYLPEGRDSLDTALSVARIRRPDLADQLSGLHAAMLADPHGALATRIQQTSGMVMAKGVEDTTYYRWNRFVALNEVGGDPSRFGVVPAGVPRRDGRPRGRLAGHHDNAFHARHQALRGRAGPARRAGRDPCRVDRCAAPVGGRAPVARPLTRAAGLAVPGRRVADPGRPAGRRTWARRPRRRSWSPATWTRCRRWTRRSPSGPSRCWPTPSWWPRSSGSSSGSPARAGATRWARSCCSSPGPGVPDVYQGTELFEYSLVDPDNRRPVDWELRRELLARLDDGWLPDVDAEGAAKLLVTASALRLRRYRPEVFTGYRPLLASGPAAGHVVAFQRSPPWSRWPPGCRSGWPRPAAGATPCCRCRTGPRTGGT